MGEAKPRSGLLNLSPVLLAFSDAFLSEEWCLPATFSPKPPNLPFICL